jgi:hypothetical protein
VEFLAQLTDRYILKKDYAWWSCSLGFVISYKHRCLLIEFPKVRICKQKNLALDLTLKLSTPLYIRTTIIPEPHLIFVHWSAVRRARYHNMTSFCNGIRLMSPASGSSSSNIHRVPPYKLLQVTWRAGDGYVVLRERH